MEGLFLVYTVVRIRVYICLNKSVSDLFCGKRDTASAISPISQNRSDKEQKGG